MKNVIKISGSNYFSLSEKLWFQCSKDMSEAVSHKIDECVKSKLSIGPYIPNMLVDLKSCLHLANAPRGWIFVSYRPHKPA